MRVCHPSLKWECLHGWPLIWEWYATLVIMIIEKDFLARWGGKLFVFLWSGATNISGFHCLWSTMMSNNKKESCSNSKPNINLVSHWASVFSAPCRFFCFLPWVKWECFWYSFPYLYTKRPTSNFQFSSWKCDNINHCWEKCGALMNVCDSLRAVEKGKKSMMKLLRIFGSVHVLFK